MKKKIILTPFDRNQIPPKQNLWIMLFLWFFCWIKTRNGHLVIQKENMKGLKPPFLVLGSHHSFMDFYITPLALFPYRANYVSELEGFEAYGEWPYRQIGCLGTRKFVNDIALVRNIKRVVDRKGILVLYPEARYANVGTSSKLPDAVGKLIKLLNVPVVVIQMHGNYLQSPIWNLSIRKGVKLKTTISQILTKEELKNLSTKQAQEKIENALSYDEYHWQQEEKMVISYPKRAEGLEHPLYQCPICQKEANMKTEKTDIFCTNCDSRWHMTEYGALENTVLNKKINLCSSSLFSHIPDWYEWEREQVKQEIENDTYFLNLEVHIESLPNAKNFIDLGDGFLKHSRSGFTLILTEYDTSDIKTLFFPSKSLFSIHTEYDYRGKGECITLSTLDNTYFIYPKEKGFHATKIQFAVEYFYELSKNLGPCPNPLPF